MDFFYFFLVSWAIIGLIVRSVFLILNILSEAAGAWSEDEGLIPGNWKPIILYGPVIWVIAAVLFSIELWHLLVFTWERNMDFFNK
jgi:hypothetical protein